jgi:hypothetical protein
MLYSLSFGCSSEYVLVATEGPVGEAGATPHTQLGCFVSLLSLLPLLALLSLVFTPVAGCSQLCDCLDNITNQ